MPLKSTASLSVITTLKPKPRIVPPNRQFANQIANQLRGTERHWAAIAQCRKKYETTILISGADMRWNASGS
jgi:hypothetical protein